MTKDNPKYNIATVQKFAKKVDGIYIPSDVKKDMGTEPGKQVKFEQVAPGEWKIYLVNFFATKELQPA